MPYSDWKAVVDPKVKGTWNIHNSCKDRAVDLDFFIMTGSLMSLLGLPGQANYVSANAFLDAFAQYRWGLGLPAFCIQVGVVAEVGYVSRDDKISQRLATLIEYTMGPRELLDALHLAIDSSKPLRPSSSLADSASRVPLANSRMVGTMTTGVWSNQSASQNTSAMLRSDPKAAVLQNIGPRTSVDTEAKADKLDTFLADIESDPSKLTTAETAQFLATEIRKAICRLTMTDETVTKLEGSLEAAGIDSLMSVELRSWFLKRMRIRLRTTDLLGSRSILSLGELSATLLHTRMK
jgi:acyl carrier protein